MIHCGENPFYVNYNFAHLFYKDIKALRKLCSLKVLAKPFILLILIAKVYNGSMKDTKVLRAGGQISFL